MRRLGVLLAAAALLVPGAAGAAIHVRAVDASGYPHIRLTVVTGSPTAPPSLLEDGQSAAALHVDNLGKEKSIALLVDRSRSMAGSSLTDATAAARAFIAAKAGTDRVAVIAFGSRPVQLTGFSSAPDDAEAALSTLRIDRQQGTALYDAVSLASSTLAKEPTAARVILLVTDGKDVSSRQSLQQAVDAARAARAVVYSVAIASPQFTPDALQEMASATGGVQRSAATSAALTSIYRTLALELNRTWQLDFLTAGRPGDHLQLVVDGDGTKSVAVTVPGQPEPGGGSFKLPASAYTFGGMALLGLAVALLVLAGAAIVLVSTGRGRLHDRLAPHLGQKEQKKQKTRKRGRERFAMFAGLFRLTERALAQTRQWKKVQRLLERADFPLRAVELFYISLAISLGIVFLLGAAGASSILILVGLALGFGAPLGYVAFKASRRAAAFEDQLPDLLMSIASTLKAGHSFRQGIQAAVDEGLEPAGKEFRRALAETRLGRPLEDSLGQMAERLGSANFAFIVTAVNIQNQVGGSLAGLFDTVADTVRQRQQFARKIKSLTAMGRMSAYTLLGLPFVVAGALTLLNPEYMSPLYNTPTGKELIGVAIVMMVLGGAMLRKIITFKG